MAIREIIESVIFEEFDSFLKPKKWSKDTKTFTVELSTEKMNKETKRLYDLLFCNWGEDILEKVYQQIAKNVHKDLEGK